MPEAWRVLVSNGVLTPPALDLDGYLDCLHRCRERFPAVRTLSGVELSEPHWHSSRAAALLRHGSFDRVLAAVHSAADGAGFTCIALFVRGGDIAAVVVADIIGRLGLRALDAGLVTSSTQQQRSRGLRRWRAYRDRVIGHPGR